MKPQKQDILNWLQNPDYHKGMLLLQQIKPNIKVNTLRAIAAKLCFHFQIPFTEQMIGTPMPPSHKDKGATKKTPSGVEKRTPSGSEKKTPSRSEKRTPSGAEVPDFIEKIIREHTMLVNLRSQMGDERHALGSKNDAATMKKRKMLSGSINQQSERIEMLYRAKEDYYEKGITPDMDMLFSSQKVEEKPDVNKKNNKTINALRASQARDQNMLDYQTVGKQPQPNPMPDGPKRRTIIARMKKRLKEIENLKTK